MLRAALIGALAVAFHLSYPITAPAQERARIGWAGFSSSHVPLWVAHDKGLLKKHGVVSEVIFFSNGPTSLQALVAGELDIVLTSAPNVVNPRLAGGDVVMILAVIPTFVDHIVAASTITSPEQLKGKIGGVNRQGSVSEMGLRLALRRLGVDPEKDTKIVSSGGNPERLAALSKGIVQFVILSEPTKLMLRFSPRCLTQSLQGSRRCSMTWRRATPRPPPQTPKPSSTRASFRSWSLLDSSNSSTENRQQV